MLGRCQLCARSVQVSSLLLLKLLTTCAVAKFIADTPVVRTTSGLISGARIAIGGYKVDTFFGIPYAEPPLNDLRFRKPVAVATWNGTFRATKKPIPCVQTDLDIAENVTLDYTVNSEDCLYLNVWRPAAAAGLDYLSSGAAKLPVVVFIHGGAFQWGDSSLFAYDGANFVATSGVVFVSFNYRLNIFGFLSSGADDVPGNWGFWDQVSVLRWVRENIGKFGGDPDDVTLYGQSSGAMSAGIHAISPQSKGLFRRLIMQSGSPINVLMNIASKSHEFINSFAAKLNCYNGTSETDFPQVMECLRRVDKASYLEEFNGVDVRKGVFAPVHGDEFLPMHPLALASYKKINSEAVLIGTTADEGSLFLYNAFKLSPQLAAVLDIDFRTAASVGISVAMGISVTSARRITEAYLGDSDGDYDHDTVLRIFSQMVGDGLFVCPANYFAELASDQGIPVYKYEFGHRPSFSIWPSSFGATHVDDIPFTLASLPFYTDESRYTDVVRKEDVPRLKALKHTVAEDELVKELAGVWADFMKSRPLTIPLSKEPWPRYTSEDPQYVNIQLGNYTKKLGPKRDLCNVWRPFLFKG